MDSNFLSTGIAVAAATLITMHPPTLGGHTNGGVQSFHFSGAALRSGTRGIGPHAVLRSGSLLSRRAHFFYTNTRGFIKPFFT